MIETTVLYEDDEIYIINKPSGLASQGGANVAHSVDVDFAKVVGQKVFLVHRLDKDTAGLMVVAKTAAAASKWTKLIAGKSIKKEYVAICAGKISPKKGVISESIVQHGEIKKAVTHYSVEKEIETGSECGVLSQVRLVLETGRMHQIRIHLAKSGCPIAGDDQHGDFKMNKLLKKNLGIKKLLLAAVKLTVPFENSPDSKKIMKNQNESGKKGNNSSFCITKVFEIPLPDYFQIEKKDIVKIQSC